MIGQKKNTSRDGLGDTNRCGATTDDDATEDDATEDARDDDDDDDDDENFSHVADARRARERCVTWTAMMDGDDARWRLTR